MPPRQTLLLRTPPRTQPRSCSPACGHGEVAELLASSSTSSRDHTVLQSLFSLSRSTPASSMRSRNSPRPLPFRATRAPQQLRQELSDLLRLLLHALPCHSTYFIHPFQLRPKAPPRSLHRGQTFPEHHMPPRLLLLLPCGLVMLINPLFVTSTDEAARESSRRRHDHYWFARARGQRATDCL